MKKDIIFLICFFAAILLLVHTVGCASAHPKTDTVKGVAGASLAGKSKPDTAYLNDKPVYKREVQCPVTGDCEIELTIPIRETTVITIADANEGNNKVPLWVKYFALPAAGAAAGAGYFGMKYPNEFNEEEGTVFYSGTTRGVLVGAASGVILGLIVDLFDD